MFRHYEKPIATSLYISNFFLIFLHFGEIIFCYGQKKYDGESKAKATKTKLQSEHNDGIQRKLHFIKLLARKM